MEETKKASAFMYMCSGSVVAEESIVNDGNSEPHGFGAVASGPRRTDPVQICGISAEWEIIPGRTGFSLAIRSIDIHP
jgi:hypothetical protein